MDSLEIGGLIIGMDLTINLPNHPKTTVKIMDLVDENNKITLLYSGNINIKHNLGFILSLMETSTIILPKYQFN